MNNHSIQPPVLLKITIDILLLLIVVVSMLQIILLVIIFWNTEETLPFAVHPNFYEKLHIETYFVLPFFLSRILFIYTILKFKHLVDLFFKGIIFSIEQAKITGFIGETDLHCSNSKFITCFYL